MIPLDLPNILLMGMIVGLILTTALTKMLYHHDIAISYISEEGCDMVQFFILSFEKDIPWTALREAASVFLTKSEVDYTPGSEVVVGSNRVALKRVFHPCWRDSAEVAQELFEKDKL